MKHAHRARRWIALRIQTVLDFIYSRDMHLGRSKSIGVEDVDNRVDSKYQMLYTCM